MNKGIIMEIKRDYAIALNDSGVMEKILSKKDMRVGQKIFYFEEDIVTTTNRTNMNNIFIKRFGAIAAIFLLVFTFFQGITYENAYAVVSLDINPSIQIEVSSKKNIVSIEGMNDDGKEIDFSNVIGNNINDGIEEIKKILIEKNYLDNNKEVLVAFALVKEKDDEQYEESVKGAIQEAFKTENVTYVKVANKDAIAEAKTKGVSLGRYEASLTANEEVKKNIEKIPVKDITSSIKDNKNVIHWEAQEENMEEIDTGITSETDVNKQQTIEKPAIDKPVQKPATTIPAETIKPDKNEVPTNRPDSNTNTEDNGVLEVLPENQTPSDEQVDVPSQPENKTEEDNIIVVPDNNSSQNNETTDKVEEDNGTTNVLPDSENTNKIKK